MKLTCVIASFAGLLSLATAGISPKRDATWNTSVTILHASGSAVGENPSLGAPASHGFNVTLVGDNYFPWGSEIHCSGHPFADMTWLPQTVHDMGSWCKNHRLFGLHWEILYYGGSQSYVCNYAWNTNSCSEEEFWKANALFDKECGRNGAYIWIPEWAKVIGRDPYDMVNYLPECTNIGRKR